MLLETNDYELLVVLSDDFLFLGVGSVDMTAESLNSSACGLFYGVQHPISYLIIYLNYNINQAWQSENWVVVQLPPVGFPMG